MPTRLCVLVSALALCRLVTPAVATAAERPVLEAQRGRYFRWVAPAGWRADESTNGVTLTAPGGDQRAGLVLLMRTPGASSPRDFVLRFVPMDPAYRNLRVESERPLPDVPGGIPGVVWKMAELGVSLTVGGKPHQAVFTCAVKNAYGQFDAVLTYHHAAVRAWPAARQFLPQLTRAIAIVNPGQVAMSDQLLRPRNDPLDNSGLLESWRRKGVSEARISQARREGTMGYERMKDPATGRAYDMPFEAYDGAAGGYRNPRRPTELLVKAQPGE